ncbi:NACHT domain-containing protein [Frankia sp. AgB1.9]|nr:NACHT domain-containing protein [Frankia sp. AgW1.1]MBL7546357.1 NACHT domain-containing protein [Frankia sp. AgB1.9]
MIVVRVEDCDRPGLLRQVVSVDIFGLAPREARDELLKAARGGRRKPTNAPVFRRRSPDPALDLHAVADQLAVAVRRQWEDEAALRRLNDPYPLPVRWDAADSGLLEGWASMVRLATFGAGWPPVPPSGTWAAGPGGLAGGDGELAGLLGRVPTGRLVVLGEPGSGKTMLTVRLVLDLLADGRRAPGGPVPVLVSLASWNPAEQPLHDWLEERLVADHPSLTVPVAGRTGVSRARALLDAGLVLAVLDGLDEIGDAGRGAALARINDALRPGQRLVLTSRTTAYQQATSPADGPEVRLAGAAGIQLCPLDAAMVGEYLRGSAGGSAGAARWDPLLTAWPAPVAQALTTPLMTTLARVVYNPRPGESVLAVGRLPAELLDPNRFPTRTAVEQHLFDGFLPAAYRPHPDPARRCRWKAADAERWLIYLARHLDHTLHGTPDLAWWELPEALSRGQWPVFGLVGGFVFGLGFGMVGGLVFGPVFGLVASLVFGLVFGLAIGFEPNGRTPAQMAQRRIFLSFAWWRRLVSNDIAPALAAGLVIGLVFGIVGALAVGLAVGIAVGIAVALAVGLVGAFVGASAYVVGFSSTRTDLATAASPIRVLRQDRAAFRTSILALGLVVALALVGGLLVGPAVGLAVVGGVLVSLVKEDDETAWGMFVLTRAWLATRGRLPRNLMAFLADAHEIRGVLRQVGAVYQFRHIELQHRLANRP